MGTTNQSPSKNQMVKSIWSVRKQLAVPFTGTKAELESLTDEELTTLYSSIPVETQEEPSTVETENLTGISVHFTQDGSRYTCIALELIETNGLSFRFKFNDNVVVISNDIDLYKIHKSSPFEIGTKFLFNYDGVDTFRKLSKNILVPNTSKDHPYRGTLNKSQNDIFAEILLQKDERKMQRQLDIVELADESGKSIAEIRKVMSTLENKSIEEMVAQKIKARMTASK